MDSPLEEVHELDQYVSGRRRPTKKRSTESLSFQDRIRDTKRVAGLDLIIREEHSFYGMWPDELGVVPVDDADPYPGMLARVARFHEYMTGEFESCTGVFIGKTTRIPITLRYHIDVKRRSNEIVVMLILHVFKNKNDAIKATHEMPSLLSDVGIPGYDRDGSPGDTGKCKVMGTGPIHLFALLLVSDPKI